jgi:NADH-quinone oxidoreductase subunit J
VTTRPELKLGSHLVPGLAAAGLFVLLAAVTLAGEFPEPQGFPEGVNITASIGYAMFNVPVSAIDGQTLVGGESFLVAFIVIAIVLDAALDGAIMLARREEGGSLRTVLADGGRRLSATIAGRDVPADVDDADDAADADVDDAAGERDGGDA